MPLDILVYNTGQGTTGSLTPSLQSAFHGEQPKLVTITPRHIEDGILNNPAGTMLVLPGIAGETSRYSDELTLPALNRIKDFVSAGGVLFTICAGSYFVSRQTIYNPAWGPEKQRHSLSPLFNGIARGPLMNFAAPPCDEPRFGSVVVVPVQYKAADNQWQSAGVCYGNGPALYPDQSDEADTEILATFLNPGNTPGPAAILRKRIGKGALYMSAVLPEIGYQALASNAGLESARILMQSLHPHEQQRHELWSLLTGRMKRDLKP